MEKSHTRNIGHPGVVEKPVGSLKISVLNGSRQIDQVVTSAETGQHMWETQRVLGENGLPKGAYFLDAAKTIKKTKDQTINGQVLHADKAHVYQFNDNILVKHDLRVFEKEPAVGGLYVVDYSRGTTAVHARDIEGIESRGPFAVKADDFKTLSAKQVLKKYPSDPAIADAMKLSGMVSAFRQERLRTESDRSRFQSKAIEKIAQNIEHGRPNLAPDVLKELSRER